MQSAVSPTAPTGVLNMRRTNLLECPPWIVRSLNPNDGVWGQRIWESSKQGGTDDLGSHVDLGWSCFSVGRYVDRAPHIK
jgi:hypothetical protein